MRQGFGGKGHRHDESVDTRETLAGQSLARGELVGRGKFGHGNAVLLRHRGQRVSGHHGVVAPGVAASLGNEGGALRKERGRTRGQVQVE